MYKKENPKEIGVWSEVISESKKNFLTELDTNGFKQGDTTSGIQMVLKMQQDGHKLKSNSFYQQIKCYN